MSVLVISGTGTGVGKTIVTAALAALAMARGDPVAVVKPTQTGVAPAEPGDLDDVRRLAGVADLHELARFPAALAPATAARVSGRPPVDLSSAAAAIRELAADRLVLVEGAGGLLVRLDGSGATVADLARRLGASVLVVTRPDLGTLNHTALTLEALDTRGLACAGVVVGAWPADPDLACRCNVADLEELSGRPLSGAMPAGAGTLAPEAFGATAWASLGPELGGAFDAATFRTSPHRQEHPS